MPGSITIPGVTDPIEFITLAGQVHELQTEIEDLSRIGLDGTAIRALGKRGRHFEMLGVVDTDTIAAANTLHATLSAAKGKIIGPLVDDFGKTIETVICWDVAIVDKKPLVKASGGLSDESGALLTVHFVFQDASS